MRSRDHAHVGIDQQYRAAIGRSDADGEALVAGVHGVRAGAWLAARPWCVHHHGVRRMDLVHPHKMFRRDAHRFRHAAAILDDIGAVVVRAQSAIEAFVDAAGDATLARKERVAKAGNSRQQRRGEFHAVAPLAPCLSSLKPASWSRCGSVTASTLNIVPMPPRPPPISRFSAPEMSSETSGVVLAISVTARASMPSRLRKSPCSTGPWTRAPTSSAARPSA